MRIVSDFREAMWGVLQQGVSTLDVDFVGYAAEHFDRLLANAAHAGVRAGAARRRRRLSQVPGSRWTRLASSSSAGGITGCSVAFHLAEAGWTDVLLVEKAQLTAGSTCHAAGLVTVFNPSSTMMQFRRYSVELYERLGVFERVGSLRLASQPDQLLELERAASRARGIGLDVGVVSAERGASADAGDLVRVALRRGLPARRRPPRPTSGDPCRWPMRPGRSGVRIRTGVRVTGFELSAPGDRSSAS